MSDVVCIVPSTELEKCPFYKLKIMGIPQAKDHYCRTCSLHYKSATLLRTFSNGNESIAQIQLENGRLCLVDYGWLFPAGYKKKCNCAMDILITKGCQCGGD